MADPVRELRLPPCPKCGGPRDEVDTHCLNGCTQIDCPIPAAGENDDDHHRFDVGLCRVHDGEGEGRCPKCHPNDEPWPANRVCPARHPNNTDQRHQWQARTTDPGHPRAQTFLRCTLCGSECWPDALAYLRNAI